MNIRIADKKERPSEEGRIYAARLVKSSLKSAVRRFGSEQDKGNQTVIQLSMGNLQTNLVPIGAQFLVIFMLFLASLCMIANESQMTADPLSMRFTE